MAPSVGGRSISGCQRGSERSSYNSVNSRAARRSILLWRCVFNNIARESRNRNLQLRELSVTANGGFGGDELSTGIAFSISIAGDGSEDELRSVATFGADDSTIANVLRHPTSVALTAIDVRRAG